MQLAGLLWHHLRYWTHSSRSSGSVNVPSQTQWYFICTLCVVNCFLKHTACSTSWTYRFKIDCMSGPSHLVCVLVQPVSLLWMLHLDILIQWDASQLPCFPASKSIYVGFGFFELLLREEWVISSLKSYFRSHFYSKPVILSRPVYFTSRISPKRSLWRFYVSNSTANEGAIGPKGVPAAYMWTLNVFKSHFWNAIFPLITLIL